MEQIKINDKFYYKKDNNFYGTDKNNKPYKVSNKILLEKLNKEEVGLGTMVEKVTKFFGIQPCESCNKRKDALNTFKLFPHLRKDIRELNSEELQLMVIVNKKALIENDNVNALFKLYNDLFKTNLKRCNCPGLVKTMIERINVIINIQNDNLQD